MMSKKRGFETSNDENDAESKRRALENFGFQIVKNPHTELQDVREIRRLKYLSTLPASSQCNTALNSTSQVKTVLTTVDEYRHTHKSQLVNICDLDKIKNSEANTRELRKSVIVGRCVTKTSYNTEQVKFSQDEDDKRTEFFRTEFIDDFDSQSEVRFNNFNKNAMMFYDKVKIGKVYGVENFSIVNSNKMFNALPNDYEASFVESTKITELLDEGLFPMDFIFSFTPIGDILKIIQSTCIDLEGIVLNFTDKRIETNWRTGKKYLSMYIELFDKSGYSIRLKLTEQYAERFTCSQFDVYKIHNVKVTTFGSATGPVPMRRLVRVMRCSHHDNVSDTASTASTEIIASDDGHSINSASTADLHDFDDEDDAIEIENDKDYDDDGQFYEKKTDDDDDETLIDWYKRIGHNITPTPLRLLKFAERQVSKFEKGKVLYDQYKQQGVKNFLKLAALDTGLNRISLDKYLSRFRQGAPLFKPYPWRYDRAIDILRQQKARGEKENRAAAAKEAGINPGALTRKLKAYPAEFSIKEQAPPTPELHVKALELYRAQPKGKRNVKAIAAAFGINASNLSRKFIQQGERQIEQSKNADPQVLEQCFERLISGNFKNLTDFCLVETAANYNQMKSYLKKAHPEWKSVKTHKQRYKTGDYKSREEAYQRFINGQFINVADFCKVDKAVDYLAMEKYVKEFHRESKS